MSKYKFKNRKFPKDFQKVVDYIYKKKGILVQLSQMTNYMGHFTRIINIHHNYDLNNNGLFALLHECGHSLQPPTNIGVNSYKNIDEESHQKQFILGRLLNEIDAWDKGMCISNELDIKIDMKQWNLEKENALITYLKL
tara:strand:- start:421 stop:837 length:417 start_codon:yes stop_codon:yes gene_type:complete